MQDTNQIKSNKELIHAVNVAIKESGCKKSYIADKLGMNSQVFSRHLNKANFSLDDANKILSIIGYEVDAKVIKKNDKNF